MLSSMTYYIVRKNIVAFTEVLYDTSKVVGISEPFIRPDDKIELPDRFKVIDNKDWTEWDAFFKKVEKQKRAWKLKRKTNLQP